jgi:hypothetical protein
VIWGSIDLHRNGIEWFILDFAIGRVRFFSSLVSVRTLLHRKSDRDMEFTLRILSLKIGDFNTNLIGVTDTYTCIRVSSNTVARF